MRVEVSWVSTARDSSRLPRRRAVQIERRNGGGIVEHVRDDRHPQVAASGEEDESIDQPDRGGEEDAKRALIPVQ